MSAPRKPTATEELERIEDALVQSVLTATGPELREEIAAAGDDPDALIAGVDAAVAAARAACARTRLEGARSELAAWREKKGNISALEREAARSRLERLKSGGNDPDNELMMAARKGQGLSDGDFEGLIEDMAELKRLERDSGED
jgi:hypothetical protein